MQRDDVHQGESKVYHFIILNKQTLGDPKLLKSELQNVNYFTRSKIFEPNFTPKKRVYLNNFGTFSKQNCLEG